MCPSSIFCSSIVSISAVPSSSSVTGVVLFCLIISRITVSTSDLADIAYEEQSYDPVINVPILGLMRSSTVLRFKTITPHKLECAVVIALYLNGGVRAFGSIRGQDIKNRRLPSCFSQLIWYKGKAEQRVWLKCDQF